MWAELDTPAIWQRHIVVTATRGPTTETLVVTGGQITADSRRALRWSGTLTVAAPAPLDPSDLLTPFGTRISIELGIRHPDGTLVRSAPFGQMMISRSSANVTPGASEVELTLSDLGERIGLYRYETPLLIPAGVPLEDVADAVLLSRLGVTAGLDATGMVTEAQTVHGLTTAADPWAELVDLFAASGLMLYYDGSGTLVAEPPPVAGVGVPIGQVDMAVAFEHRPANVIVARGESSDPTVPPVLVVVSDDDPGSPTYAGPTPGSTPYGRITDYVDSPMILTTSIGTNAAQARLADRVGVDVDLTRAWDPSTLPGDTLLIGNPPSRVLVDAVTVDLVGETTMVGRLVD